MKQFFYASIILFCGCAPKVLTNYTNKNYSAINSYESFGIIKSDTIKFDATGYIGKIEIKDNGLSINCDYKSFMPLLKTETQKVGGNLVRIDKHKKPSIYGSSCHQITASVFRVQNPRPYEEFIYWNKNRKLVIEDFKGSIEKRPFQAATTSGIEYYIKAKLNYSRTININVWSRFECFDSYFKHSNSDADVLAHEQLHFDMSEVYKRLFIKELLETKLDILDYTTQIQNIHQDIYRKLMLKQDEYDSEVYKDSGLQPKWDTWITSELERLKGYDKEELKISL